jgi:RHH-type proline utilization regulon transcriptional repressor/proline dehydrogenase/delta 1-pyrroline-5-carboxylate dehydrogenase
MENLFSQERDCNKLIGEKNIFRYLPLRNMALRIYPEDELCDVLMAITAANIARTPVTLSITREDLKLETLQKEVKKECIIIIQSDDDFMNDMGKYERIRTCNSRFPYEVYKQAARFGKYIAAAKPLTEGRVELLHYLKEQSVAFEYHRYGSITDVIE